MSVIEIRITAPDAEVAERIARRLVGDRLAACVQQVPGLTSTYVWEGEVEQASEIPAIAAPPREELAFVALSAPPMKGLEYLNADVLADWWMGLDAHARDVMRHHPGGPGAYLREKNAAWRLVGRVTFHLAENKRDPQRPFAFLATYTSKLSAQGQLGSRPGASQTRELLADDLPRREAGRFLRHVWSFLSA